MEFCCTQTCLVIPINTLCVSLRPYKYVKNICKEDFLKILEPALFAFFFCIVIFLVTLLPPTVSGIAWYHLQTECVSPTW